MPRLRVAASPVVGPEAGYYRRVTEPDRAWRIRTVLEAGWRLPFAPESDLVAAA